MEKDKIIAAGAIFLAKDTQRILLNYRSLSVPKPGTFGFWGGKVNKNETVLLGLTRELEEEIGFIPKHEKIFLLDVYLSKDLLFEYYSFIIVVPTEFIPKINDESSGYMWLDINSLKNKQYPKPIHPGAKTILENKYIIGLFDKLAII